MGREQSQSWRVRLAIALDSADRMHAPDVRGPLLEAFNGLESDDDQRATQQAQEALDRWHRWSSGKPPT